MLVFISKHSKHLKSLLKHLETQILTLIFLLFKGSDDEKGHFLPNRATETSMDLLGRSNFFKPTFFFIENSKHLLLK